jgi:hypothetical protein
LNRSKKSERTDENPMNPPKTIGGEPMKPIAAASSGAMA